MSCGADLVPAVLAGQNVLHPHSPSEHQITVLWWVMFGVACVGLTLVAVLLLLGWIRRNSASLPFGGGERAGTILVISLGIALPLVLLTALFVWSDVFVIRSVAAPAQSSTAFTVRVVGHQFWWELDYGRSSVTANELHIPVRTRVRVAGTSADVIHSFWVPELNRKIDLIPGYTDRTLLYADRAGTYLGQCAEFCGMQHARMQLAVVAQPRAEFEQWLRTQAQPAPTSQLFLSSGCANCHQIRGTPARGHVGPDLTHVGSRMTLAAGTIPNDREHLREWLRDPQAVKRGSKMPQQPLSRADIDALVDYLESLK
jgi:cytochrome c oxidase subunit 2